ncbi:MAG: hypothetical protein OXG81_04220 [Acidobacteria bacterium]|nr:hypothetical protein [Acidobacteriota bacterium]
MRASRLAPGSAAASASRSASSGGAGVVGCRSTTRARYVEV